MVNKVVYIECTMDQELNRVPLPELRGRPAAILTLTCIWRTRRGRLVDKVDRIAGYIPSPSWTGT